MNTLVDYRIKMKKFFKPIDFEIDILDFCFPSMFFIEKTNQVFLKAMYSSELLVFNILRGKLEKRSHNICLVFDFKFCPVTNRIQIFGKHSESKFLIEHLSWPNWEKDQEIQFENLFDDLMKLRIKIPKSEIAQFDRYLDTQNIEFDPHSDTHICSSISFKTFKKFEEIHPHHWFTS